MAIVSELFNNRSEVVNSDSPRIEVHYVVTDAVDEAEVISSVESTVPLSKNNLSKRSIAIDERVDQSTWKVVVTWEFQSLELNEGDSSFAFDTGGASQHITQSLSTVATHGPKASSQLGGAIGFDGETVQGVDIVIPQYTFSETHVFPDTTVTTAYKQDLFNSTGKINDAPFKGFAAGEVLFIGASGAKRGDGSWEIAFRFTASPNKTNLTVGGITGIDKKGFEYLWVQYAKAVDNTVKVILKKPVAVYIEQVYEDSDFSVLGIGS